MNDKTKEDIRDIISMWNKGGYDRSLLRGSVEHLLATVSLEGKSVPRFWEHYTPDRKIVVYDPNGFAPGRAEGPPPGQHFFAIDHSEEVLMLWEAGVKPPELMPLYLRQAILSGNIALCQILVDALEERHTDVKQMALHLWSRDDAREYSLISWAAACTQPECITFFISKGCRADAVAEDAYSQSIHPYLALPFYEASRFAETVATLKEGGIEITPEIGDALSQKYARSGHPSVLAPLVAAGLDPHGEWWSRVLSKHVCLPADGTISDHAKAAIDIGFPMEDGALQRIEALPYFAKEMPLLASSGSEKGNWKPDKKKIETLLAASVTPEQLVGRCLSFGVDTYEVFHAIAEQAQLADRQLLARLHVSETQLITIKQEIMRIEAGAGTSLQTLSESLKNKPRLIE